MIHFYYFKFIDILFLSGAFLIERDHKEYRNKMKEQTRRKYCINKIYPIENITHCNDLTIGLLHQKIANIHRDTIGDFLSKDKMLFHIENASLGGPKQDMPVIFVEQYIEENIKHNKLTPDIERVANKTSEQLLKRHNSVSRYFPSRNLDRDIMSKGDSTRDINNKSFDALNQTTDTPNKGNHERQKSDFRVSDLKDEKLSELSTRTKIISNRLSNEIEHVEGSIGENGRNTSNSVISNIFQTHEKMTHLIVLAHGYEGGSFDMKLIKNVLCHVGNPHLIFHSACANENNSTGDIDEQGKLLAAEVHETIRANFKQAELKRLSFIGHSLGGLVVRAALPHLLQYKDLMHTFISMNTPHLGCTNGYSTLVKTGLSVFSKFKGHKSLSQMNLSDTSDMKESFIYRLSKSKGIEWFEHFIVVSSFQDLYVPFESARIEYGNLSSKDKKRSHFYKEMSHNILQRLKHKKITRFDINFIQTKGFDGLIGRTPHIRILENLELQIAVAYSFMDYLN